MKNILVISFLSGNFFCYIKCVFFFSFLFLVNPVYSQFTGLVVNEFSQGTDNNKEYIEILVVGTKTCTDSTADIRGWIFDDQNGWYGNTIAAPGHYRFKYDANWSAVPYGSIIVVYNANDRNTSLPADDENDTNPKDYSYIVPNISTLLEQIITEPSNTSGTGYVYPSGGYITTTYQWTFTVALTNSGDVINLVSPADRTTAFFSIGYGYPIAAGYRSPSVSIGEVFGGSNAYLTDANYASTASWAIGIAPTNETPGQPNGGANSTWINSIRLSPIPLPPTAISPQSFCINTNPSVADLVATGSNLKWYNVAVGGTALAPTTALSTGTYYVTQTVIGCESARTAVSVIINPKPANPTITHN